MFHVLITLWLIHCYLYTMLLLSFACHSCIHLFTHSFIHPFIHSVIHSFGHSFIHSVSHSSFSSFVYLFVHSFIHLFIHAFIHSPFHSFVHLFVHSFIHLFIRDYIHAFIHSVTHSFKVFSSVLIHRHKTFYVVETKLLRYYLRQLNGLDCAHDEFSNCSKCSLLTSKLNIFSFDIYLHSLDGERKARTLFLMSDVLICAKLKPPKYDSYSLLVVQNFATARNSSNILLTY